MSEYTHSPCLMAKVRMMGPAHAIKEAVQGVLPAPQLMRVSRVPPPAPLCWVSAAAGPLLWFHWPRAHWSTPLPSCHVLVWFCSVLSVGWVTAKVSQGNMQNVGILLH